MMSWKFEQKNFDTSMGFALKLALTKKNKFQFGYFKKPRSALMLVVVRVMF